MTDGEKKIALVTGGARRIGAAISESLARRGHAVVLTYRESRSEARALARAIGGEAVFLDLSRPGSFPRFASRFEREHGRLDLLVHNAAVFPRTPIDSVSAKEWDRVFAVNLRGPILLTRELVPLMRRPGGGSSVVFMGDAGAGELWPAYLPYCLSKAALEEGARALRKLLAPGIRVGIVRPDLALIPPGFPKARWEAMRSRRRLRGPDSPVSVAEAVLRLAR